jgi:hypothetical protein
MAMPGFVLSALLFTGVVWLFWWLVERSGGVAGQAFTVARSINTGVASWVTARRGGSAPVPAAVQAGEADATDLDGDGEPLEGENELNVRATLVRRARR